MPRVLASQPCSQRDLAKRFREVLDDKLDAFIVNRESLKRQCLAPEETPRRLHPVKDDQQLAWHLCLCSVLAGIECGHPDPAQSVATITQKKFSWRLVEREGEGILLFRGQRRRPGRFLEFRRWWECSPRYTQARGRVHRGFHVVRAALRFPSMLLPPHQLREHVLIFFRQDCFRSTLRRAFANLDQRSQRMENLVYRPVTKHDGWACVT